MDNARKWPTRGILLQPHANPTAPAICCVRLRKGLQNAAKDKQGLDELLGQEQLNQAGCFILNEADRGATQGMSVMMSGG